MKQLIDMIEAVAYEKAMPEATVREAMESAIASLARKESREPGGLFHAEIDKDGNVSCWRIWEIVDNVMDEDRERLGENVGDMEYEEVPTPKWTRQGLQVVKQVLAQRLKQGLRQTIADAWKGREGDVVMGVVKRIDKNRIIVDLGEPAEGVIAGKNRIPGEMFKIGHRVRACVDKVNAENMGPVIELSRTSDQFLRELIAIEVPEVDVGQVKIRSIARDPGSRAKIAVEAGQGLRNHPAAVCVGMRGVRAQAITSELNGERLEFIEWVDNPAEFLLAAMAPAEVTTLYMDEGTQTARVAVAQDKLARAIGSRGQNVRLASKLTGWTINLMSNEDYDAKMEEENQEAISQLVELMDMDEEFAQVLVEEGFMSVEDIFHSSIATLMSIDGVDEETAEMLKERATDAMLVKQMFEEPDLSSLASVEGMNDEYIAILNGQGIVSMQDLADQATDDVEGFDDPDMVGNWIMDARRKVGMI